MVVAKTSMKLVRSGTSRQQKFAFNQQQMNELHKSWFRTVSASRYNTVLSIPRKFYCTHKFGFDAPSHKHIAYLFSDTHNSHVTSSSQYI